MSELDNHLRLVQDIAKRTRDFHPIESSNPKNFSKSLVEDLATLADAVSALIERVDLDHPTADPI